MKANRTFDTGNSVLHTMYHWVSKVQLETMFLVPTWSLDTFVLLSSFFFSHRGLARGLGGVYRRTWFILMENSNFRNKPAKIGYYIKN
jgi:hypothetical protein